MSKVILQLGGNINRMETGLKLLQDHPDATMIISSELPVDECVNRLKKAKIPKERFVFDYQAWDTVTNFTMTYPRINGMNVKDLYIVSDLFHIPRVKVIAEVIYFKKDIRRHYISHGTDNHTEEIWYDFFRALFWRLTGYLLYDEKVKSRRMPSYISASKRIEELLKTYEV